MSVFRKKTVKDKTPAFNLYRIMTIFKSESFVQYYGYYLIHALLLGFY